MRDGFITFRSEDLFSRRLAEMRWLVSGILLFWFYTNNARAVASSIENRPPGRLFVSSRK